MCLHKSKTHAGSTLFQHPTVPQCEGAFRVEMGLKKKCLSIKSFTADHNGCIQNSTFFHLQCQETEFCCAFRPHVSLAHTALFIDLSTSRELTEHVTETCLRHSNVML